MPEILVLVLVLSCRPCHHHSQTDRRVGAVRRFAGTGVRSLVYLR